MLTQFVLVAGGGYGRRDDRDNTGAVILLVVLASAIVYALSFLLVFLLPAVRGGELRRGGPAVT